MSKQNQTAKIRAMLQEGKSDKEIAAKLKVKPATVYQVRYRMKKEVVKAEPIDIYTLAEPAPVHDPVNRPAHYTTGKIETIDYIDDKRFNYTLGNAIKYISRAPHKGHYEEDLLKAIWYINHAIKLHREGRG